MTRPKLRLRFVLSTAFWRVQDGICTLGWGRPGKSRVVKKKRAAVKMLSSMQIQALPVRRGPRAVVPRIVHRSETNNAARCSRKENRADPHDHICQRKSRSENEFVRPNSGTYCFTSAQQQPSCPRSYILTRTARAPGLTLPSPRREASEGIG